MIGYLAANGFWTLTNAAAYARYRRAVRHPRVTQERLLRRFLRANAESDYGRRYDYAKLRSVRDYQNAVPIATYDDLEPWVERIRHGRAGVLTSERVLFFEKTSGSSGQSKYIPYTASLLREFRSAVAAWMFDLFTGRPALLRGAQYWSISPLARDKEFTLGGLKVGIEDDTEYLGRFARAALHRALAVPASVAQAADMETCRRLTLEHLMRCRRLRFISVWHPSFLTLLVDRLPCGVSPRDLWPELRLISCWTSGASAQFVDELRTRFQNAEVQGKGLLATEGVVSFPELGKPAPSAAITSHFLEFLDDSDRPHLIDEVDVGRRYQVLLTTGNGFARYKLGDVVEVVAPGAIEFVGRAGGISDLCGEKLSEAFVARLLEEIVEARHVKGMAMLAPEQSRPPRYVLLTESDIAPTLAEEVEKRLRASAPYDYCRRLGQLGPVVGVRVVNASEHYLGACVAMGQRAGNAKPAYLRTEFGWREWLEGGPAHRQSAPPPAGANHDS